VIPEFPGGRLFAGHRNKSQLYGCYQSFEPASIEPGPLREAANKTVLEKQVAIEKGKQRSSFARVQSSVAAAFLGMPESAYDQLRLMATQKHMHNSLMTGHDPGPYIFNVDANGGVPGIVGILLMQSHGGELHLLPALPAAWPNGKITGIQVRGGFEVDLEWSKGKLQRAKIHSHAGQPLKVRNGSEVADFDLAKGKSISLNGSLKPR
jgi:alpha-L-fucosidase 2